MRRRFIILAVLPALYILHPPQLHAQVSDSIIADSIKMSTPSTDTAAAGAALPDSLKVDSGLAGFGADSLGQAQAEANERKKPLPPPTRLIDSLVYYFARHTYQFDVKRFDLYPRNAAGFVAYEASYFTMISQETPLRTTVSPYGLPGGQMAVWSGANELSPYDCTVPLDGKIDFNDIATGDVAQAGLVEGPLAGFGSTGGAASLLYLEPFTIPADTAVSRMTAERGAYGYAYTRGRIARTFFNRLGFAFSTDYRKGEGFVSNADDDSYNVKARVSYKYCRETTLDADLSAYRRAGGYLSYRRLRRDGQMAVSLTRQEMMGGQFAAKYTMNWSRSADFYKTIKPLDRFADLRYLLPRGKGVYQAAVRFGDERYDINLLSKSRYYGWGEFSGISDILDGKMMFYGRVGAAEKENLSYEGVIGLARPVSSRARMLVSAGYLYRRPDLADMYLMFLPSGDGLTERGNSGLKPEKKLIGNAAVFYSPGKAELSASLNAGHVNDIMYYDRRPVSGGVPEIVPDNDNITYTDLNLSGSFDSLWLFFGRASVTGRRLDSDRFGERPPYSPRWQVYGRLGLGYFVEHFKVNVRLFGDVNWTERPLSYSLQELETLPIVTTGLNASLKDFTFYYMIHNFINRQQPQPEGYGYTGWFYSWGFNWTFKN